MARRPEMMTDIWVAMELARQHRKQLIQEAEAWHQGEIALGRQRGSRKSRKPTLRCLVALLPAHRPAHA